MIAALVTGLLLATDVSPHQTETQRAMQVAAAREIAESIAPGATVDEVHALTARRLGLPAVELTRCPAGGKCTRAYQEAAASRRNAAWVVADHVLVVVFCGGKQAWRVAAVDLSTADRPNPLGNDSRAVYLKVDPELAKGCTAG